MTMSNAAISLFATLYRALVGLAIGKLVVTSFGTGAFAAHAQATVILTALLPISCGFISLALTSAAARGDQESVSRYLAFGASWACLLSLLAMPVVWGGGSTIARATFGDVTWLPFIALLPLTALATAAWALATAMLLGAGKGRGAVGFDLLNTSFQLVLVLIASSTGSMRLLVVGLPICYLAVSAVVVVSFGSFRKAMRAPLRSLIASSILPTRAEIRAILPFISTGVFASLVGPVVLLYARAATMHQLGAGEASSFVAAQRIAALVSAPAAIYTMSFLSAKFVKGSLDDARATAGRFAGVLVPLYSSVALLCGTILPLVVDLAFSRNIAVSTGQFAVVSVGELGRATGSIYAQMYAARGMWRAYVAADLAYVVMFLGSFIVLRTVSGNALGVAYLCGGVGYLALFRLYPLVTARAGTREKGNADVPTL